MPRLVTVEDLSQSKVTKDLTAQCIEPGLQGVKHTTKGILRTRAEDGTFRCHRHTPELHHFPGGPTPKP